MPRPPQAAELSALRQARVAADAALNQAIAEVEAAQRARDAARRTPGADTAPAQTRYAEALAGYRHRRDERNALLRAVAAQSAAAARAEDDATSAALFTSLEGDQPIALLPVRLETRYARDALGRAETLQVRVYPDDLHVQRHVAALTEAEREAGLRYWQARFDAHAPRREGEAGVDPEAESDTDWDTRRQRPAALWRGLVRALRAPRAAHVVHTLRPANAALLDGPPAPLPPPECPDAGAPGARLAAQPQAVMLPDRFCAIGLVEGQPVFMRFGEPVPDVLAAAPVIHPGDAADEADAPVPAAEGAPGADQPAPPDPFAGEARWLAHFDTAVAQGMGLRITQHDVDAWRARHPAAPAFRIDQPLDQLIVLGIDWTLTPEEAAAGLGALLEAHAASGGLAFLPVGTPTNNTGSTRSGHSPAALRDPATPEPPAPATGTGALEGLRLALGLADEVLSASPLPHQRCDDGDTARHMLDALYRALAGAYLEEFWVDPNLPAAERRQRLAALDALRDHVVTHLRPMGPLQPLRVGDQPYGLLPVVAPQAYAGADAAESTIKRVLDLLRPSWTAATGHTARFDGQATTTHALLRHGPWAQAVSYREVARDTIGQAARQEIELLQQQLRFHPASLFVQALGAALGPAHAQPTALAALQVATLTLKPQPSKLPAGLAWVQADAELKHREADPAAPLAPDYLGELAARVDPAADTRGRHAGLKRASSLLQGLAAYALDLEIDAANRRLAARVPTADGASIAALPQLPRHLGLEPPSPQPALTTVHHVGELHHLVVPSVSGSETLGQFSLRNAQATVAAGLAVTANWSDLRGQWQAERIRLTPQRDLRHLARVTASLQALGQRDVGTLNWALRSTLGAFDDRLDAWYTSLATRRLAALRAPPADQADQADPTDADAPAAGRRLGVQLGAWGVVEGLQPDPIGQRESRGHLIAPSLRHAAAAAVLRSGHLANDPAARAAFALDLSSRRVRAARDLFEGLAQGQPLAALIGYRFERALRDAWLGQHILRYRQAFPMRPLPAGPAGSAEEAIAAREVTDGVALLAAGPAAADLVPDGAERRRLAAILAALAGLWDAVSDVAVAEGVYQITQGNMERAAAALAMLDKQAMPVEPQSVQSPRDAVRYTQRLVWLMDPAAPPPAGWPEDALGRAEPAVNAWLAELIGPPGRFQLTGRVLADDGTVQDLTLDPRRLGLSPLALMLALDAPGAGRTDTVVQPGTGPGNAPVAPVAPAEEAADPPAGPAAPPLQELSRLRLALVEALFAAGAAELPGRALRLQVDEQAPGGAPDRPPGLVQLEALLGLARRLVTQARPAAQRDLAVTEGRFTARAPEGDHPGVDAAELDARAQAAVAELVAARQRLDDALQAGDAAATEAALHAARGFGIPGALADDHVPRTPEAAAQATLDRGAAVRGALDALLAQVATVRADIARATTPGRLAPIAIDTLKAVFGRALPVLPRFVMGEAAAELQAGLAAQPVLTAGRRHAVTGWLPKLAKVRRGVEQVQSLLLAREVLVAPLPSARFAVWQSTGRRGGAGWSAPWAQPWLALPEAWPAGPEAALLGTAHQRPDLAVAALLPDSLQPAQAVVDAATMFTGIVCDDWSEAVPLHTQDAAVAFHFDAPGARAPQAVLLAVPPKPGMAHWDFDTVLATVREALALSRLRLVKPAELEGVVNLALPLNLVRDGKSNDIAGLDLKWLVEVSAQATVASRLSDVLATGKT